MKEIQERVREFCEKYNLTCSIEFRFLDLVSELGEVAKEILKATDYGKKSFEMREEIKGEMGDVLFSLIVLANQLNIDLESALEQVLKKYQERIRKKGEPSSGK